MDDRGFRNYKESAEWALNENIRANLQAVKDMPALLPMRAYVLQTLSSQKSDRVRFSSNS